MTDDQFVPPVEQRISMSKACRSLSVDGRAVHLATAYRYASEGRLAPSGDRVRLRTWNIPGKRFTTENEVERFILALSEIPRVPPRPRGPDPTDDALERLGVGRAA